MSVLNERQRDALKQSGEFRYESYRTGMAREPYTEASLTEVLLLLTNSRIGFFELLEIFP
jgi:hypothetical protein